MRRSGRWHGARVIEIPHLCYTPAPDYRADGNCRVCMVEIAGERVLAPACLRKPAQGMRVSTASARAAASRKMVMELLVADQPIRDAAPDPDSSLWGWADRMERDGVALRRRASVGHATRAIPRWR